MDGIVLGILVVYSEAKNAFGEKEMELLQRLADNVAYGIKFIRERHKRIATQKELQVAHDKLEIRVKERTSDLEKTNLKLQHEIAERKKTELDLRKLYNAIEQLDEMVLITDTNGVIQYANHASEKMTEYAPEEFIGKKPNILKSGKHKAEFYIEMWNTINKGNIWHGFLINKKKSGELYFEEMTISPVKDDEDKVSYFVSIKRDITNRKKADEEMLKAKEIAVILSSSSS